MTPEVIAQLVTILAAVWYSSRGITKRLMKVEVKLDALPCIKRGTCQQPVPRPRFIVVKGDQCQPTNPDSA